MTVKDVQTRLSIKADDLSSLREIRQNIEAITAQEAQRLHIAKETTEQEKLRVEQVRAGTEAERARADTQRSRGEAFGQQAGVHHARTEYVQAVEEARRARRADQHADREHQEQRSRHLRQIHGAGAAGAGVLGAAAGGSPASALGGIGAMFANPWVAAGTLIGGAALGIGWGGVQEARESYLTYNALRAGVGPFGGGGARYNTLGRGIEAGIAMGFRPTETLARLGAYESVAGLGARGLPMEAILGLERFRGIQASQLGAFSSVYGAGGGARGNLMQDLHSALAEGVAEGFENAKLGDFLTGLSQTLSRFAAMGVNIKMSDLVRTMSGLRQAGGDLFAGQRGLDAIQRFGDANTQAADLLGGFVPQEMMTTSVALSALQETGSWGSAMMLLEEERGTGRDIQRHVRQARRIGGNNPYMQAALLRKTAGSMHQAMKLPGFGPGPLGNFNFLDVDPLTMQSIPDLAHQARLEWDRVKAGSKMQVEDRAREEQAQELKQGLGAAVRPLIDAFIDVLNGEFGAAADKAGGWMRRAVDPLVPEQPMSEEDLRRTNEQTAPGRPLRRTPHGAPVPSSRGPQSRATSFREPIIIVFRDERGIISAESQVDNVRIMIG